MGWMRAGWSTLSLLGGILVADVGLESFLLPNQFIDGGVTGLSMLIARLTPLPLSVVLIIVNAPFIVLGYHHIGRTFAIRSAIAIVGLAVCLAFLPLPVGTHDKMLGALFGGFFVGAGVGLAMRGGGVLDGTEILAVILGKRTFATVGEAILALNVIIFAAAGIFLGLEPALYSILTYFAASQTIDYLLHGIEAYHGVLIVSSNQDAIRQAVLNELGRGVTTLRGKGGYSDAEQEVLFCVVTRLESTRLEAIVKAQDENAFVVIMPVHDTTGGMVKRRVFH